MMDPVTLYVARMEARARYAGLASLAVNVHAMLPAGTPPATVTDWLPYFQAAFASLNPNGADPCGGTVYLPAMSTPYWVSDTVIVPNKCVLLGAGRSTSQIKAMVSFDTSHPLIRLGSGSISTPAFGCRVENLFINCADIVDVGVFSNQVNEQSGVRNCLVSKWRSIGVDFNTTSGGSAQLAMGVVESEILPSTAGPWLYGIRYAGMNATPIHKNTVGPGTTSGVACVYIDSCPSFTIDTLHCERAVDGVYITGSVSCGRINGLTAVTGVTANGVHLSATNLGRIAITSVYAPAATNVVQDEASGLTVSAASTGSFVEFLILGKNQSGPQGSAPIFGTSEGVANRVKNPTTMLNAPIIDGRVVQASQVGAAAIDLSLGNFHELQLVGNISGLTINGGVDGTRFTLRLKQDATGGRTVAWAGLWKFIGGTTPTLGAANTADWFEFMWLGNSAYQVTPQASGVPL